MSGTLSKSACTGVRALVLVLLFPLAVADGLWLRIATVPKGSALAHARAAWLHRWSRTVRRVLGLRLDQRGFTPVSGIVVARHAGILDAILIAALRPCVIVAGAEARRRPLVGWLARLGGTIFIDRHRRHDAVRVNFMIQRAVQRRLLVVIFPECGGSKEAAPGTLTSTLFQPAAELGCTLTAAIIDRPQATISFSAPAYRRGNRKQLARQLSGDFFALQSRHA